MWRIMLRKDHGMTWLFHCHFLKVCFSQLNRISGPSRNWIPMLSNQGLRIWEPEKREMGYTRQICAYGLNHSFFCFIQNNASGFSLETASCLQGAIPHRVSGQEKDPWWFWQQKHPVATGHAGLDGQGESSIWTCRRFSAFQETCWNDK